MIEQERQVIVPRGGWKPPVICYGRSRAKTSKGMLLSLGVLLWSGWSSSWNDPPAPLVKTGPSTTPKAPSALWASFVCFKVQGCIKFLQLLLSVQLSLSLLRCLRSLLLKGSLTSHPPPLRSLAQNWNEG